MKLDKRIKNKVRWDEIRSRRRRINYKKEVRRWKVDEGDKKQQQQQQQERRQ